MKCTGKTDIGKKRTENQDAFSCKELDCGLTLLTVCDGMGGANGGGTASKLALDTYNAECENLLKIGLSDAEMRSLFGSAVSKANAEVFNLSKENPELSGMGTTLVSLLAGEDDSVTVINVGDSRAYMITKEEITQLSHDHSYVQYLVDLGEITKEKAEKRPDRNLIMKAVGIEESVKPDVDKFEIQRCENESTYLLLCSDGLSDMVKDADIKKIVNSDQSLEEKAEKLISTANKKGGNDNITVILAEI